MKNIAEFLMILYIGLLITWGNVEYFIFAAAGIMTFKIGRIMYEEYLNDK